MTVTLLDPTLATQANFPSAVKVTLCGFVPAATSAIISSVFPSRIWTLWLPWFVTQTSYVEPAAQPGVA